MPRQSYKTCGMFQTLAFNKLLPSTLKPHLEQFLKSKCEEVAVSVGFRPGGVLPLSPGPSLHLQGSVGPLCA